MQRKSTTSIVPFAPCAIPDMSVGWFGGFVTLMAAGHTHQSKNGEHVEVKRCMFEAAGEISITQTEVNCCQPSPVMSL